MAMIRVDREFREDGMEARLILQVHDELIVEAPEREAAGSERILKEGMEGGARGGLGERYKGRAFAVAVGIVGDGDDALDVVQDSFIKAYYKLKEFRFGSNFYTWFYRLLVNQAIDRWRKSARSARGPFDESGVGRGEAPPRAS